MRFTGSKLANLTVDEYHGMGLNTIIWVVGGKLKQFYI